MNRRNFLKTSAMTGAGALLFRSRAWPFAQSPTNLRKFITTLPGLGPARANNIGQYLPLATKTMLGYSRAASWEELNERLLEQCRERRMRRLRGH